MKEQLSKKTLKIEELVRKDLSNGRHATKKLKYKLLKAGLCTETVCRELMQLKIED